MNEHKAEVAGRNVARFLKNLPLPVKILLSPVFLVAGIVLIVVVGLLYIGSKIFLLVVSIRMRIDLWQSSRRMKKALEQTGKEIKSQLEKLREENPAAYQRLMEENEKK